MSSNNDKAIENDPLIARLEGMGRLPTKLCSWPMSRRILDNPALLKRLVEVGVCPSVGRGMAEDDAEKIMAAEPEMIGVNFSPLHGAFYNYDPMTKEEVIGPAKAADWDNLMFFFERAARFKRAIGDTPVTVMFDFELSHIPPRDAGYDLKTDVHENEELGKKLNWFYKIAKVVFGGDVFFYNARQWVPGPGLQISPANNSQIPTNTETDFAAVEWYHGPFSLWNREVLRFTVARTVLPVVIVCAVGGSYLELPFTAVGSRRFSEDFADPWTEGEAWQMGNSVLSAWSKRSPEKFGPRHDLAWAYPALDEYSDDALVWMLQGGLGITREME